MIQIRQIRSAAAFAVVTISALLLPACTVAAAGAAVGVAQSGAAIIEKGRVTTALLVRYEDVPPAVEFAAGTLSLDVRDIIEKDDRVSFYYAEEHGGKVTVYVARRTDSVTSLIIDVGATGRPDIARLMHAQVIHHLDEAGVFIEDWSPAPGAAPDPGPQG